MKWRILAKKEKLKKKIAPKITIFKILNYKKGASYGTNQLKKGRILVNKIKKKIQIFLFRRKIRIFIFIQIGEIFGKSYPLMFKGRILVNQNK